MGEQWCGGDSGLQRRRGHGFRAQECFLGFWWLAIGPIPGGTCITFCFGEWACSAGKKVCVLKYPDESTGRRRQHAVVVEHGSGVDCPLLGQPSTAHGYKTSRTKMSNISLTPPYPRLHRKGGTEQTQAHDTTLRMDASLSHVRYDQPGLFYSAQRDLAQLKLLLGASCQVAFSVHGPSVFRFSCRRYPRDVGNPSRVLPVSRHQHGHQGMPARGGVPGWEISWEVLRGRIRGPM